MHQSPHMLVLLLETATCRATLAFFFDLYVVRRHIALRPMTVQA